MNEIPVQFNYFEPIMDYIYLIRITPGECDIIKRSDTVYCEIYIPDNLKIDVALVYQIFRDDVRLSYELASIEPRIYRNIKLKGTFRDTELGMHIFKLKSRIRFSFTTDENNLT